MARMSISPAAARNQAMIWRGAAVALALGAGALWAFRTPFGASEIAIELPAPGPGPAPTPGGPPSIVLASLDTEGAMGVQERMDHAYDRPPKPEPQPGPQGPPTSASVAGWRFLGAIIGAKRRSALISVNGKQHVVREGNEFEERDAAGTPTGARVKLIEVRADSILIQDAAGLHELKKEQNSGPRVAWVTPGMNLTPDAMQRRAEMEQARAVRAAAAAAPGIPGSGMTPDQQAALRERGITPAHATQMRDRLEQVRARARNRGNDRATVVDPAGTTTTTGNSKGQADESVDAPESLN